MGTILALSALLGIWRVRRLRGVAVGVAPAAGHHTAGTQLTVGIVLPEPRLPPDLLQRDAAWTIDLACIDRRATLASDPGSIECRASLPRGLFSYDSLNAVVTGPLGLFSVHCRADLADSQVPPLRVVPSVAEPERTRSSGGGNGVPLPSSRGVRRNDELVETRPYHPGDDPRRLHWGQYARTGELYVRVGEEVPPPRRRTVVVIDWQSVDSWELMDRLVDTAVSVIASFPPDEEVLGAITVAGDSRELVQILGMRAATERTLAGLAPGRGLVDGAFSGPIRCERLAALRSQAIRIAPSQPGDGEVEIALHEA